MESKSNKGKYSSVPHGQVYVITNKVTGKKYVGQTTLDVWERFDLHVNLAYGGEKSYAIGNAIYKHGAENFSLSVLASASSKEELDLLEIEWIERLNTFKGKGYNETPGRRRRLEIPYP